MSYPRDLVGYGATPPQAQWPDGARLAVQRRIDIANHWRKQHPAPS